MESSYNPQTSEYTYSEGYYGSQEESDKWNYYDPDWYEEDKDFYSKKNITEEDENSMIGQVSFFLDKCPKGWKKQHLVQRMQDNFEYDPSYDSCLKREFKGDGWIYFSATDTWTF